MEVRYNLTKLSKPGFTLEGAVIRQCRVILENFICSGCMDSTCEDSEFPLEYPTFSEVEKVDALLGTACGCEFYIEENIKD